ncbi:PAS domain-containing protein [Methylobacterium sp. Leaf89]|uniref:PAS domain-containing protein n=1 Tax=Methylobacterium sp. Leaf89 TaxID=1736245 RepID=UPI0006F70045|nr:PAS domain-containing protein [Methylobacterium sp. Leaf89]KQO71894.1 histidine kinase [Methylobacterium sp. Leaf89]
MPSTDACSVAPTGWTESDRLAELASLDLAATGREPVYDDLTRIAALLCNAPIALVSLVEADRQWFKGRVGFELPETPRRMSICAHALEAEALLVIPDLTLDPRTRDNPLVTGERQLRFYAGAVIRSRSGYPLGTLCVLDGIARPEGITPVQAEMLEALARQAATLIELTRTRREVDAREAELEASERRFRVMTGAMPQMVWTTRPDGYHDFYNDRWYAFTGVPPGSTDGEAWNGMFHPDDQDRAWSRWRHSLATGDPYEVEYRLRHHSGAYRWTLGRAMPLFDAEGRIERWFGTCTDIEDLKRAEAEALKLAAIVEQSQDFIGMADREGFVQHINEAGRRLVGLPDVTAVAGTQLLDYFMPESQALVTGTVLPAVERQGWWEGELAFQHFGTGEGIAVLYNIFPVRDDEGRFVGYATVTRDLRERKRAEEAQDLLIKELSHRIKNIFAVVGGIAGLSARTDPAARPFVSAFRERLGALAQAHEYVRPHSPASAPAVKGQTLFGLMRLIMAAYVQDGRARIFVDGDDVAVGERAATALALIMHEQATNAMKYGGLSTETGGVRLTGRRDGPSYILTWAESGGPTVTGPPTRQGFGTVLAQRSVVGQLDGTLEQDWAPSGLVMRLVIPVDHLKS